MMRNSSYIPPTNGNADMKHCGLPLLNDCQQASLLIVLAIQRIISACYVTCSSTVKSISLNLSLKENPPAAV